MKTTNAVNIAAHAIRRFIEALYKQFLLGQTVWKRLQELTARLVNLDHNNSDYAAIRKDFRENMKVGLHFLLMIICLFVDYILVSQPSGILAKNFGLPAWIGYVFPSFLILLEIGVAYSQVLNERKVDAENFVMRNLQYVVIVILIGFSALYIGFTISAYDPRFDGSSFIKYLVSTILFQVCFLIAGILLHLFLIKNSEIISETIGYISYRISRVLITSKIKKLQKEYTEKTTSYKKNCMQLVIKIHQFRKDYPDSTEDFEIAMPVELMNSVNTVLGKRFFNNDENLSAIA